MKKKKRLNADGFTLIEMILVLFVISVLMLLIVPNVVEQKKKVDQKGTEALLTVVQTQVELYEMDTNKKAASFDDLKTAYLNDKQLAQAKDRLVISNGKVSAKASSE